MIGSTPNIGILLIVKAKIFSYHVPVNVFFRQKVAKFIQSRFTILVSHPAKAGQQRSGGLSEDPK
jgi:hypothetical protein